MCILVVILVAKADCWRWRMHICNATLCLFESLSIKCTLALYSKTSRKLRPSWRSTAVRATDWEELLPLVSVEKVNQTISINPLAST